MTDLRQRVAGRIAARYRGDVNPWLIADLTLEALGLNDLDGFIRRMHEGYFDDGGPSNVEYACMRSAVEYAFTPTGGTEDAR